MINVNKTLSLAYFLTLIIGGVFFLSRYLQFKSYALESDVWGIIITIILMLAILYVAKIHWKASKRENEKLEKFLVIVSSINILLSFVCELTFFRCDELGCVVLIPIVFVLFITFTTALVLSIKVSKKTRETLHP